MNSKMCDWSIGLITWLKERNKQINLGEWGFKEIQKYTKSQPWIRQWFLGCDAKGTGTKEKIDKLNFMKILKICISKDTGDRATHRLRENICKSYIRL